MSLAKPILPKSAIATFKKILEIIDHGWYDIPNDKTFEGDAAPGDFLEHLLGGKKNNRDSPDLNDWEFKFHGGTALITLFHKEPEPRGIMRFMVHEHGWPDHLERISFRHTLGGKSNRGFYVVNEADRVVIRHNTKDTVVPYWRHNTLLNAAGGKLRRLIVVNGELTKHPTKRVKYNSATAYWDLKLNSFFEAMVSGDVFVDFDARTQLPPSQAIRNHGTKFRIKAATIPAIYEYSTKVTIGKG
jgi:hypothetical protein